MNKRIRVSEAAYRAIAATLPGMKPQGSPLGGFFLWLDETALRQLEALRGPGEGFSDAILRLTELEAGS